MKSLPQRIKECKTRPELDSLRLEIVKDEKNFLSNQQAFIKKLNQLKRIPLRDRTW